MNALFVLRPAKLRAFNFGHPCPFMNALLVSHPCETLGVQLRASMPLYERSVDFASLRNSGRSTSGVHARPLSKVRCCRPKKFGRLPEGLPHHHPSLAPNLPKPHYPLLCTNTLASPRKRVRFCCSVKPSQLWWGLLPICTINEIFRTIPLSFRRGAGLCQE